MKTGQGAAARTELAELEKAAHGKAFGLIANRAAAATGPQQPN